MAEIVNLRQVRKRLARAESERAAAANRVLHGRTRVERELTEAEKARAARELDAHQRESGDKAEPR